MCSSLRSCGIRFLRPGEKKDAQRNFGAKYSFVWILFLINFTGSGESHRLSLSKKEEQKTLADLRGTLGFLRSRLWDFFSDPDFFRLGRSSKKRKNHQRGHRRFHRRLCRAKMVWVMQLSGFIVVAILMILFSPTLQSSSPSPRSLSTRPFSWLTASAAPVKSFYFRRAQAFRNAGECASVSDSFSVCDPCLVHVAITLDVEYLRGSIAAVHSILQHALCPENIFFHFLVSETNLETLVRSTFPELKLKVYYFDPEVVRSLISTSVRQALEQPLNYARNYLADLLEPCVRRVIYLDSDLVVVDDIAMLWRTSLGSRTIGAPEYCHANFTKYFTAGFWSDERFSGTFAGRIPCYFNTGVMVMDLERWRRVGYTRRIERWMQIQKSGRRIYELGSLPPFLLVFAGHVAPIEHRWNQHGLGGDNVRGSCRDLHPGPVSLLHWSGSGKPWIRLDEKRPCPLDSLWAPYDLYDH